MRAVLVTGGSRGIGEALVRRLTRDGDRVVFTYHRSEERAREIARATGADCLPCDLSLESSIACLAEQIEAREINCLVNNALPPPARRLFLKTEPSEFLSYLSTSLHGVIALSQALARCVRRRGGRGAIVNVLSSVTLGMPPARLSAYVTAKCALLGLTRSMAIELIASGIRVNAVSPGMTRTEFNAELPDLLIRQIEQKLPMNRLAVPEEVAGVIRFLLSEDAGYVNGANIPVAGGGQC